MQSDFYTVEDYMTTAGYIHAVIRFNPDHPIFEGHFPGQPVVPGVCMIQIVKKMMQQALGRADILLSQGQQLKFLQLVVPDSQALIQVDVAIEEKSGAYPIQAAFKKEELVLFKMSGSFTILTNNPEFIRYQKINTGLKNCS